VTDTNGNTAQGLVTISVIRSLMRGARQIHGGGARQHHISGAFANPDGDRFPNLLEYAMGLDPKPPTQQARSVQP